MVNLTILFKSGKSVEVDQVSNWSVSVSGDEIVSLTISQSEKAKRKIIVKSIKLSSIDCILESR